MKKVLIAAGILLATGYFLSKKTSFSIESVDRITKEIKFNWNGNTYIFTPDMLAQEYPSGDTVLNVYVSGNDVYFDQFRGFQLINRQTISLTEYSQF